MNGNRNRVALPQPDVSERHSFERLLAQRRSLREFSGAPLTLEEVARILWAAQGISDEGGLRTAPSAGALYPLEVYLVAGTVEGLAAGVYRYRPRHHELEQTVPGDRRVALAAAALGQDCVRHCAVALVLTAVYERVSGKYGERGPRYAHIEAGHAAQNAFLQAVALGLGSVVVGAFHDPEVKSVLHAQEDETPLCIMPFGRRVAGLPGDCPAA